MNDTTLAYTVMTDTGADLPWQTVQQQEIQIAHLHYQMEDAAYAYDLGRKTDLAAFYYAMRNGARVSTIPVLPEGFCTLWEPVLSSGRDILQLTISRRMSNTFQAAQAARLTMLAKYPVRRIVVVDTLCCAVAQGMLVYEASQMCREGKSLDEVAEWAVQNRQHVNGLLMPAELHWLKEGGMYPGGGLKALLGRKSLLCVDAKGDLHPLGQAKDVEDGLHKLAAAVRKSGYALNDQVISVTHADDPALAQQLCQVLKDEAGCGDILVLPMSPLTGCYAGPGAVGVAFFGSAREG